MKKNSFQEHHLFQMLRQYEHDKLPFDLLQSRYFRAHRALGSKDRQFIANASYTMLRWQALLDFLIGIAPTWEKRYDQLKNFRPEDYFTNQNIPLDIRLSIPKELLHHLIHDYGETKAQEIALTLNGEAPVTVRINPLKTSREDLLNKWQSHFEIKPCFHSPIGICFHKREPLTSLAEYKEGLFEIQDEASQLAALLVGAKAGEQVLDYCAGAGGKTLGFAPQMHNKGQVYLHDIRPFVLQQAKKRLKRAGIQNAQFLAPGHKKLKLLKEKMDWIMLDVPCSGVGTLRRNPDQKWKFTNAILERLCQQQREIFAQALYYLKPGGKIVYATCSILRAENQDQIDYFLKQFPVCLEAEPFVSLPTPGKMDGFFAAVFKRA